MNQDLSDYIKKAKEQGIDSEKIKQELLQAGWKAEDIDLGLAGPLPSPGSSNSNSYPVSPSVATEEKNTSKLKTAILVIVPLLLIIAGGALAYKYVFKPFGGNLIEKTQYNSTEESNNETVQKEEIKNCGSFPDLILFFGDFTQFNEQQKELILKPLNCISEALKNCEPAKIEEVKEDLTNAKPSIPNADEFSQNVTEDMMKGISELQKKFKEGTYEIIGKEGDNCIITKQFTKTNDSQTCKIPMAFINETQNELNKRNSLEPVFLSVPIIFFSDGILKDATGTVKNFNCQ